MKKRIRLAALYLAAAATFVAIIAGAMTVKANDVFNPAVTGGFFKGIPEGMTIGAFSSQYANPQQYVYDILNADATETLYSSSQGISVTNDVIKTGYRFRVYPTKATMDEYRIVILGDVDCTGSIGINDYLQIKLYCQSGIALADYQLSAADVDENGKVGASDYLRIKRYLRHTYDLFGRAYTDDTTPKITEGGWTPGWEL